MSRSIGIVIPEGCKQLYVFEGEEDFIREVNSGRMTPLYGLSDKEKSLFPIFIACRSLE